MFPKTQEFNCSPSGMKVFPPFLTESLFEGRKERWGSDLREEEEEEEETAAPKERGEGACLHG